MTKNANSVILPPMDAKLPICFRKQLLENLHLDRGNISTLITNSEVFKDLPKKHGYPTAYKVRDVFILMLADELLELNQPFRAVDLLICRLDKKHIGKILVDERMHINDRSILLVSRAGDITLPPGKVLLRTVRQRGIGAVILTIIPEAEFLKTFKAYREAYRAHTVIKLYQILEDIHILVRKIPDEVKLSLLQNYTQEK
ncbi:MAG: hypothetical protein MRK02_11035 [Candidatus Scalindua sp.]|nr:hypothetical protein [Candidatus Scalindua sp.]